GRGRKLKSLPGPLDVFFLAPGKSGNLCATNIFSKQLYRSKIAVRCYWKTCLDDVYAELLELKGHAELLLHVHTTDRRLLSIAQSRVEDQHPLITHEALLCRVSQLLTMHESWL